jgi:hypothetical protein
MPRQGVVSLSRRIRAAIGDGPGVESLEFPSSDKHGSVWFFEKIRGGGLPRSIDSSVSSAIRGKSRHTE